jgi:C4-dicarboxylate transporter DctM subunit
VIIPPSIPMILYGVSAEVSIGELFIAGFGPGLLIGGALMLFVYLWCRWKGWGKNDGDGRLSGGPRHAAGRLGAADAGDHPGRHLRRHLHAHRGLGGGGVLRALRRHGRVYREIGSPTCADPEEVGDVVAVIMFIIANAGPLRLPDHARRRARRHRPVAEGGAAEPYLFLLGVNAALFVIGMFIETSAAIIVLAPILAPVACTSASTRCTSASSWWSTWRWA